MASTITLQGTVNASVPLIGYRPLAFPGLSPAVYEPAITMGNIIMLTMLGPPFGWRWNRQRITFTCNPAQGVPTDYPETVSKFGWMETAEVNDLGTPAKWLPMTKVESMGIAEEQDVPRSIAAQYDDGAGSITFRVGPSPDQAYPVAIDIQNKPVPFTQAALSGQTWSPIPDEYQHIYTWGFQALCLALAGDPRFAEYNQKFVAGLLATHQGLSETQKSDFLNTWMATAGGYQQLVDKLQQGISMRQV